MIHSVRIFSSEDGPVRIFSLWILTEVSWNIPSAHSISSRYKSKLIVQNISVGTFILLILT